MKFPIVLLCLYAFAARVDAVPIQYLFGGSVTSVSHPGKSLFSEGDEVWYLFLVDQEKPGLFVHHQTVVAQPDGTGNEFFFVKYLAGTTDAVVEPGFGDSFYFGSETLEGSAATVRLNGSEDFSDDLQLNSRTWNRVTITSNLPTGAWEIGQNAFSGEASFNSFEAGKGGFSVIVNSTLELKSISNDHPSVPEPASVFLLSMGTAIAALTRKAKNRIEPAV